MTKATMIMKEVTESSRQFIEQYTAPETYFLSKFGTDISTSEILEYEATIYEEDIAENVNRDSEGNNNNFSKGTGIAIRGAHFHEQVNLNKILTSVIGIGDLSGMNARQFDAYLSKVQKQIKFVGDKLVRAKERAATQIHETGIVQMAKEGNWDFGRLAASIVDLGAGYWTNAAAPIKAQLSAAEDYFRIHANYSGNEYDLALDKTQLMNFEASDFFTNTVKQFHFPAVNLVAPGRKIANAKYYGYVQVAGTVYHFWINNSKAKGAQTGGASLENYMPTNKVVITPTNMMIGDVIDFPLDKLNISGTELTMDSLEMHHWREADFKQSTLTEHLMQKWMTVPWLKNHIYTMQTSA